MVVGRRKKILIQNSGSWTKNKIIPYIDIYNCSLSLNRCYLVCEDENYNYLVKYGKQPHSHTDTPADK